MSRVIKVFPASSLKEFEPERVKLGDEFDRLNGDYDSMGLRFQLVEAERLSHHMDRNRSQDAINRALQDCDLFFLIVGEKIGGYTREELECARRQFLQTGKPLIFGYFQKLEQPSEEVLDFKDQVRGEYKYFTTEFTHFSEVLLEIHHELSNYVQRTYTLGTATPRTDIVPPEKVSTRIIELRVQYNRMREADVTLETLPKIIPLYEEAVHLAQTPGAGRDHLSVLYDYAHFWYTQEQYDKAEEVGKQLRELYTEEDGDDLASLLLLLGDCRTGAEDPEGAEVCYREARTVYENLNDPDCAPDLAEALTKQGTALYKTGRPRQAEAAYRAALELYLKLAGEDWETFGSEYAEPAAELCRKLAEVLSHLAGALRYPDYDIKEADSLRYGYGEFLRIAEGDADETEWPSLRGILRHWLDHIERRDIEGKMFQEIQNDAPQYAESYGGIQRAVTVLCNDTALEYLQLRRWFEEAEFLCQKGLEIARPLAEQDPRDSRVVAALCDTLGYVLRSTRRFRNAESSLREALSINQTLAEKDPAEYKGGLAISFNNLASLLADIHCYSEAENFYRKALSIRRKLAEQDPSRYEPHLAMSLLNLGRLLDDTEHKQEAKSLLQEALSIFQKLAKQDPTRYEPHVAMAANSLAGLLDRLGLSYYDAENELSYDAERLFREALSIRRRLAREQPAAYEPDLADSFHNLAILLRHRDSARAECIALYEEALRLFEKYPNYRPDAIPEIRAILNRFLPDTEYCPVR